MLSVISHLILKSFDTTNTYTVNNTDTVLVKLLHVKVSVFNTLNGTNHSQLSVTIKLTRLLTVNVIIDVKVFYLTSKLCLEKACIEMCNRSSTTLTCQHVLPGLLWSVTQWSNGAKTCYNYSF